MKLILIITLLCLASCSRFYSQESIFLENKKCLESGLSCLFSNKNHEIFHLSFSSDPRNKDASYKIKLDSRIGNIDLATASLIGLNMEMPLNEVILVKDSNGDYQALMTPGLCTENKMLWRLKINLVLSDKTRYYTFINYQVGR